jgi:hypothetical protein
MFSHPILNAANDKAVANDNGTLVSNSDDVLLVLFTGIHGKAAELNALAKSLDKEWEGRALIYICESSFPEKVHADVIAKNIILMKGYNREEAMPHALIGFSFGGHLSSEVAYELTYKNAFTRKAETPTYIIDTPALQHLQSYIDDNDEDLLLILNHAAMLCGLKPLTLQQPFNIQGFDLFFAEKKFVALAAKLLEEQQVPEFTKKLFEDIVKTVEQNLLHIRITNKFDKKLQSVNLIYTHATANKYGMQSTDPASFGKWNEVSDRVAVLTSPDGELEKLTHLELISEKNTTIIARLISQDLRHRLELQNSQQAIHRVSLKRSLPNTPFALYQPQDDPKNRSRPVTPTPILVGGGGFGK